VRKGYRSPTTMLAVKVCGANYTNSPFLACLFV